MRYRPVAPRRILVAHHLRLGDAVLLTPLLAKLRERYVGAEIVLTTPASMLSLYQGRPYDIVTWRFDLRDAGSVEAMFRMDGFDLAFVPGDNAPTWLATALKSRWIVAHAGDRPAQKNWLIDEAHPYPAKPTAMGDIFAGLVNDSPPPRAYETNDWPQPQYTPFDMPQTRYAVLHVGASTPLKCWSADKWRALASALSKYPLQVVWSAGRGQERLVQEIDPEKRYLNFAGRLDLPQLSQLLRRAALLVAPDTGVAHLARLTATPCVTLFGPGSSLLFGAGEFWRNSPGEAVTIADFPCRDQSVQFNRSVDWLRCCVRKTSECPSPLCMQAIDVTSVLAAIKRVLTRADQGATR